MRENSEQRAAGAGSIRHLLTSMASLSKLTEFALRLF